MTITLFVGGSQGQRFRVRGDTPPHLMELVHTDSKVRVKVICVYFNVH